jgi:alanine racemase
VVDLLDIVQLKSNEDALAIINSVVASGPNPSPAPTSPTWAEVSLESLRQNYRAVRQLVAPSATICAVVKADAYGHGAAACARALESEGATWFGVTGTEEALTLRRAGIRSRLLLMTGIWKGDEDEAVASSLTPTVWEPWHLEALERAAARRGAVLPVHLKLDTGMTRLGATKEALPKLCSILSSSPHLELEGVSTHFATVRDAEKTSKQAVLFAEGLAILRAGGFQPKLIHMANSAAIVSQPGTWKSMVRPGIVLFGYSLSPSRTGQPQDISSLEVHPVLSWKTRAIALKDVPPGEAIGYGGTFVTKERSRIAVLPVGYADGFHRLLSNHGNVIVRGEYAPVVGCVSMDLTTVDVTHIPGVVIGDEVALLGESNGKSVDAHDHALICHTIPYEILCSISKRVPRIYI